MKKPPIGTKVITRSCPERLVGVIEREGVVEKHGRDTSGLYTRVRFPNGTAEDFHRSLLRVAE